MFSDVITHFLKCSAFYLSQVGWRSLIPPLEFVQHILGYV